MSDDMITVRQEYLAGLLRDAPPGVLIGEVRGMLRSATNDRTRSDVLRDAFRAAGGDERLRLVAAEVVVRAIEGIPAADERAAALCALAMLASEAAR